MSAPVRLFVGNLPANVNENELRTTFSAFGEITALDIKNKSSAENDKKIFAFIALLASNYDIESCIQQFTNRDFNGNRIYVTRARESFLERLQREREHAQKKEIEKNETWNVKVTPKPLNINLQPHKRKFDTNNELTVNGYDKRSKKKLDQEHYQNIPEPKVGDNLPDTIKSCSEDDSKNIKKQENSEIKRLESMKRMRHEFNEKKNIIKTGLMDIDKVTNKKVIFSDEDYDGKTLEQNRRPINNMDNKTKKKTLFEDGDDSDNEVNFEIKKQFEGMKGQKVLDLQSRYKADKRFVLDERFIEDDKSDGEPNDMDRHEDVEIVQKDEKYKQMNILQDVLGVPIKMKQTQDTKQTKRKLGMLRFDPTQPDHAKFLEPVSIKQEQTTNLKKKKSKEPYDDEVQQEIKLVEKVEVSKEQFYKVTDTLKEALQQPSSFSLRSLFAKENDTDVTEVNQGHINDHSIQQSSKGKKNKNPLDPGEKNPFVYDSSDSENEQENKEEKGVAPQISVLRPMCREKLFFSDTDERLIDGLLYFTKSNDETIHKDRRELKSVMKKRVYNKDRKNQMFQKKIGGRRKSNKKSFRKK